MIKIDLIIEATIIITLAAIYYFWQKKRIIFFDEQEIFSELNNIAESLKSDPQAKEIGRQLAEMISGESKESILFFLNKNKTAFPKDVQNEISEIILKLETHLKL